MSQTMFIKEKSSSIVRSLSGLINYQGLVVGVSDEFHGLFVRDSTNDFFYDFGDEASKSLTYLERKKIKPDQESLSIMGSAHGDRIVTFPSLSKSNRTQLGLLQMTKRTDGNLEFIEKRVGLPGLLNVLAEGKRDINIEGHYVYNDALFLLNRGSQSSSNELMIVENSADWLKCCMSQPTDQGFNYSVSRHNVDLGSFQGHTIQWTDGVWESSSTFLFLATVEKTSNAYDDGEVICSFMGRYDFNAQRVLAIKKILDFKKAEGLCIWNSRYLVCIDSDSAEVSNEFYSFPLSLLD